MATHTPDETRAKILAEAERLFRHYGYGKTTIGDISEACDMSPANIYRFFPSKSALVEAICSRVVGDAEVLIREIAHSRAPASERLTKLILAVYQNTLENLLDHRKVHELVAIAMAEQWLVLRTHLDRITGYIGEIIGDGIKAGEFAPCDVPRSSRAVHASLAVFCYPNLVALKLDEEDRTTPDEMADLIINALKQGGVGGGQE